MRYRMNEDPFFKKQPERGFIKDLTAPVHTDIPKSWNDRLPSSGELALKRVRLDISFPDAEGLLETAYADFRVFMSLAGIEECADGIPVIINEGETDCREAYIINTDGHGVTVTSADTEGVRRALIFLEDEMQRRGGSFLPFGEIKRKPFIKSRISRCFFTPPSHASNEGLVNELASDIDYYPDDYLNRLAHDGINGLWLGASFRDILKSSVIPEFGTDSERRLAKLNAVVEKCRRYGIGIYLFSVEPASGYENPIFRSHTELHGGDGGWSGPLFCTSTELGEKYVREAATMLFSAVPHLKGFINITTGECCSACGSISVLNCPRCAKKHGTVAKTLAHTEKLFADAIHEIAPDAEFISWTYAQRGWDLESVEEACEVRDPGVIHMQNFEDLGHPIQLGRERLAIDYWLSYVGPGELMARTAKINKRRGIRTFAKIQACSSHEISSVPYVPAPGILYDKYKYMHENGISGALQCWYFGNYPCLMNKAACELSFEPFFDTKEQFTEHLARTYWSSDAEDAARAWALFEEGYRNFPVSVSFEWFGPMQDSTAAPLHLKPVDLPMPSTWLIKDMPGGDRIGECMLDGHTEEEVLTLLSRMSEAWTRGNAYLSALKSADTVSRIEQRSVANAIDILFKSGYNVVKFYTLRHELGLEKGDSSRILSEMESIVYEEIENSLALSRLCEADARLGYHSEACGYKFFPEKLLWRVEELRKLLATEFPEIRERIEKELVPLVFYRGEEEGSTAYKLARDIESAEHMPFVTEDGGISEHSYISASEKDGVITVRFVLRDFSADMLAIEPEFRMFHPTAGFTLSNGKLSLAERSYYSFYGERIEEKRRALHLSHKVCDGLEIYDVSFSRAELGMEEGETFRLSVKRCGTHNEALLPNDRVFNLLTVGTFSPDAYCFFVSE